MIANYHTHTKRCHHAIGEDREYVEAAIKSGLKILGFSDHCPWVYKDDFVSSIRMHSSETDGYFYSLEKLKKEYQSDIKIYIGYESEYCASLVGLQDELLKDYPLDYMILGQHFLGVERDMCYSGTPTVDEGVLDRYVELSIEGLESGRYLYMAHPDLINFVGSEKVYGKHMEKLCRYLKKNNILAEINVLGLASKRHYPSKKFLEIAGKVGNQVILGIDAHEPKQFFNYSAVRDAEKLCEKYGLDIKDGDILFT